MKEKKSKQFTIFRGIGFSKTSYLKVLKAALKSDSETQSLKVESETQMLPYYEPVNTIDLSNKDVVDPFLQYFYLVLSKKFNVRFEATHVYFMWAVFELFLRFTPELIDHVSFHLSFPSAFTRRYSEFKRKIEKQLTENTKTFTYFGGKEMLAKEFMSTLEAKIDINLKLFYELFKTITVHNRINHRYHTLYLNSIWFIDTSASAALGDGINKDTGPNFFNVLEAASKKIIHFKDFRSNNEIKKSHSLIKVKDALINTETIIAEVKLAMEKYDTGGPVVLHSDSDNKQRSFDYYLKLFQNGIIPSVNKTILGPVDPKHGNQAIESFHLHIQDKVNHVIKDQGYAVGSSLLNLKHETKVKIYEEAINRYNNTEHKTLSLKALNTKTGLSISSNQAYESHKLFKDLYIRYIALKSNSQILPPNRQKIENLNLTNPQDQDSFVNYVATYLFVKHVDHNNFDVIFDLLALKRGQLKQTIYNYVHDLVLIFFAFATAKSTNPRLRYFFDSPYGGDIISVSGPGRRNVVTTEFENLLWTKEDFQIHKEIRAKLTINVVLKLHELYIQIQQTNATNLSTALIFKKTDAQTVELKQKTDAQTVELKGFLNETVKGEIKKLHTTIDELRAKLEIFNKNAEEKKELKNRKASKKRDLTPAIQLGHFMKALNIIKKNQANTSKNSKLFSAARNRLALFLLYFSGFRIGMIRTITVSDLIAIFQQEKSVSVLLSKTRNRKSQQFFSIGDTVREKFIYGNNNLWEDYKYILSQFDQWAKKNNISPEEAYNKPFFTKSSDLSKACTREYTNNIISEIIRKAAQELQLSQKEITAFSSHSFRVQFITQFIHRYGIRKTQLHMGHANINNTARYDRGTIPISQVNSLTDSLCYHKTAAKPHADVQKFNDDQRQIVANLLASQNSVSEIMTNQNFSLSDLAAEYVPSFSSNVDYCSDQFQEIEKECEDTEALQQLKLEKVKIETNKIDRIKKHLIHQANASKKSKLSKTT